MVRAHASTQRLYKLCPRCGQSWPLPRPRQIAQFLNGLRWHEARPDQAMCHSDQSNLDPQLFDMIHADARSWYGFDLTSVDDYLTIPIATLL